MRPCSGIKDVLDFGKAMTIMTVHSAKWRGKTSYAVEQCNEQSRCSNSKKKKTKINHKKLCRKKTNENCMKEIWEKWGRESTKVNKAQKSTMKRRREGSRASTTHCWEGMHTLVGKCTRYGYMQATMNMVSHLKVDQ